MDQEGEMKMPDKETVIDKLNDMADYLLNKSYSDLLARDFYDTVGYAIALLKEKEAFEPKWASGIKGGSDALCGSCMAWLSDHSWGYCPRCGRQVKWNA